MRETPMTAAAQAYAKPKRGGFDGWLVAVRATVFLFAGILVIGVACSI